MYEPYPASAAEREDEGVTASSERAGFGRRLVASLVDGIVLGLAYAVAVAFVSDNVASALNLLVGIVYYTYLEGTSGQTFGKIALGIRVVDIAGGGSIGYGRAFIRYVGRIVSAIPLFLGYLWMLWDGEKQTWHDKFARSVVVRS